MSEGPLVAPAIQYLPGKFEKNSSFAIDVHEATAISAPSVLLVGRNGSWGTSVLRSLEKLGTELSFVAPQSLTAEFVKDRGFQLVLLDSSVPAEQRRRLALELTGSETSVFYTFPVENGCWWLPTLRRGQNCHGAPAFRRAEFPHELEHILSEQTDA